MSKKTPKRRGPRPSATTAQPVAAGPRWVPIAGIGVLLMALVVLVGWWVFIAVPGGTRPGILAPTPSSSAGRAAGQTAAASAAGGPAASTSATAGSASPGGALAEAAIKALNANPFLGHVAVTTVARDATKATLERETATASGDISGSDVDLHVTDVGGSNPAVDQDVVVAGDTAWIRPAGGSWIAHPRGDVSASLDGLRETVSLLADPAQLVDLGVETIDGQQLHHLSAANGVTYQSASGTGAYDSLDLWVTETGVPVIAKGSFNATYGQTPVVGSVDIRYSDLGKAVTIRPPDGAPTLAP